MEEMVKILLICGGVLYLFAISGAIFGDTKRHRYYFYSHLCSLLANSILLIAAIVILKTGTGFFVKWDGPLAWIKFVFHVDALSGFFLLTLCLLGAAVSVYSLGYKQHPTRNEALFQPVFLLALTGLLCSFDVLSFLFFWELMSFSSFFLIINDQKSSEAKKAGYLYLVMTQFGTTLIILVTLGLAAVSGSTSFQNLNAAAFTPMLRTLFLILLLVGFGTKAGVVPLHIWLPQAHPAAPSPASALMSGFMIKAAVYGLLRFTSFFEVGVWFGTTIIIIGAVTSFLGILYAFMETDFKRLLAFCSIENIGIIFLVLGIYQWGQALHYDLLIGLGLAAVEIHVLNHAMFKGLLFMAAGAVAQECKTRNIEKMGGLIKKMPQTAFYTLIGSMAGAGLPFVSGFISEWLIFQTLFLSGLMVGGAGLKIISFMAVAALALTAGLAVATFVKLFGVVFLALPRSESGQEAKEVNLFMRCGMGITAAVCILLGIFPWLGLNLVIPSLKALNVAPYFYSHPLMGIVTVNNANSPLIAAVMLGVLVAVFAGFLLTKQRRSLTGPTWNCGTVLRPQMEYNATSFSKMGMLAFRFLLRPKRNIIRNYEKNHLFLSSTEYQSNLPLHFEQKLYQPTAKFLLRISKKIRVVQAGSVKLYLSYILVVLFLLLIYLRWPA